MVLARGLAGGPPEPSPPASPPTSVVPLNTDGTELLDVRFVDADHGFALGFQCATGPRPQKCEYFFRVTTDGGRTWASVDTPFTGQPNDETRSGSLSAAPNTVLVTTDRSWVSSDRGQTWREAVQRVDPPIDVAPEGALIQPMCAPGDDECGTGQVAVVNPDTGAIAPLANQPNLNPLTGVNPLPVPTDASLWVSGRVGENGPPAVAVSHDRGRTWKTSPLPAPKTSLLGVTVLTTDGDIGYAFVRSQAPDNSGQRNGLDAFYRTDDGGDSWQRVDSQNQPDTLQGAILLPNGRLIVSTEQFQGDNLLTSFDNGRRFVRHSTGLGPVGWLAAYSGRYVAVGTYGGYFTSSDGLTWTQIAL